MPTPDSEYITSPAREGAKAARLILARYETAPKAAAALDHFWRLYCPEVARPQDVPKLAKAEAAKVEDGWLSTMQADRSIALVFECPEEAVAERFARAAAERLERLEQEP